MGKKDQRIDFYIDRSSDFAKPILIYLRQVIHKACPKIEETIKWGFPNFMYQGAILCSVASFKQHCSFGFWKASLMSDPHRFFSSNPKPAMGNFGQLKNKKDLPTEKILISYIKEAMTLNENQVKASSKPVVKKDLTVPDFFKKALNKNKTALKIFDSFSYTNKKEYVDWLAEAKTEETRNKRILLAIEWIKEGKIRNWKYIKS
jgi:uncharacterized protein YdeI (YjbR/CyaY-like superfamily)